MSNFCLNLNSSNNVALTLGELSTLFAPHYLFIFTSKFEVAENVKKLTLQPISSNMRWDLCLIKVQSIADGMLGEVNLTYGEWMYEVRECAMATLDVSLAGKIVQRGFVIVK